MLLRSFRNPKRIQVRGSVGGSLALPRRFKLSLSVYASPLPLQVGRSILRGRSPAPADGGLRAPPLEPILGRCSSDRAKWNARNVRRTTPEPVPGSARSERRAGERPCSLTPRDWPLDAAGHDGPGEPPQDGATGRVGGTGGHRRKHATKVVAVSKPRMPPAVFEGAVEHS